MLKVAKFGGSSLSNPSQWKKVKDIIEDDDWEEFSLMVQFTKFTMPYALDIAPP